MRTLFQVMELASRDLQKWPTGVFLVIPGLPAICDAVALRILWSHMCVQLEWSPHPLMWFHYLIRSLHNNGPTHLINPPLLSCLLIFYSNAFSFCQCLISQRYSKLLKDKIMVIIVGFLLVLRSSMLACWSRYFYYVLDSFRDSQVVGVWASTTWPFMKGVERTISRVDLMLYIQCLFSGEGCIDGNWP